MKADVIAGFRVVVEGARVRIVFGTEHKGPIHKPAQERERGWRAIVGEDGRRLTQQRLETDATLPRQQRYICATYVPRCRHPQEWASYSVPALTIHS